MVSIQAGLNLPRAAKITVCFLIVIICVCVYRVSFRILCKKEGEIRVQCDSTLHVGGSGVACFVHTESFV